MQHELGDAWNAIWEWTGVRYYKLPNPAKSPGDFVLNVPVYRQLTTYDCGFAAGLSVLHAFSNESAKKFYKAVRPSPKWGTSTACLVRALRKAKIEVSRKNNPSFRDIDSAIRSGCPVLATLKRGGVEEHWVVLTGISQDRRVFISGDHILRVTRMPWKVLRQRLGSDRVVLVCRKK